MGSELHILVLVVYLVNRVTAQYYSDEYVKEADMTKPGCAYRCGSLSNITVPYPFGIGRNCSRDQAFTITCNHSFNPPRPFIDSIGLQVLSISLEDAKVTVENPLVTSINQNLSRNSSEFMKTCNVTTVLDWTTPGNCTRIDKNKYSRSSNSCSINSLCYQPFEARINFSCYCRHGFIGNPYLPHGCRDFDECTLSYIKRDCPRGCINTYGSYICKNNKKARIAMIGVGSGIGTITLLLSLWWLYKKIKKRSKIKLRKKYFKRNGGLLLQKQLNSGEEGNVEKSKLFTSKDLEMATDKYNKNRIIGRGGQGTVYKGMLKDGKIVAIKVSTIVDEENIEQFINEVVILSQINHRNVVRLHGCCLETQVPRLVYEFIPNGTLFDYIHNENEDFPLSWDVRLRIATEVASALSYLHSAASFPIYHRDIKSTNILLDEKYNAKVADFGTSRSIAIDQTHLTTRVSGTFGYLDPEYFQSSQFTEKSDVYSFGVVLVELLTSEKPISSARSDELRSLTTYFMLASEENRLFDIIDAQVQKVGGKKEIMRFAKLAKRCLNLSGRKRPTMREVTVELEGIQMPNGGISTITEQDEDVEYGNVEFAPPFETKSKSGACSDVQPLLFL